MTPTPAAQAFAARSAMRAQLAAAQSAEHVFCHQGAQLLGAAAVQLTDYFSAMIQEKMPRWTPSQVDQFARGSGIPAAEVHEWQRAVRALNDAVGPSMQADADCARAKLNQAKFSGNLWGAKKGHDKEYAAAGKELQAAVLVKARWDERTQSLGGEAVHCGGELLKLCVAQALEIATNLRDAEVRGVLTSMKAATTELGTEHRKTQAQALRAMRGHLDELTQLYEGK